RIGRSHEFAPALGDGPLQLSEHVRTALGDLVQRVTRRLKHELNVGKLLPHRVEQHLVALPDYELVPVGREIRVAEVRVKNNDVFHGRDGRLGRIHASESPQGKGLRGRVANPMPARKLSFAGLPLVRSMTSAGLAGMK